MLNSDKQQIKICFMLVPVSGIVNLASVELNGELMREVHQICHWNELETSLDLLLI